MAGQGREGAGEVSAAAEQAAQDAPEELMRGCGPVPTPQVSMTSNAPIDAHIRACTGCTPHTPCLLRVLDACPVRVPRPVG
eukprot:6531995-Prymnesium_polylepis.1